MLVSKVSNTLFDQFHALNTIASNIHSNIAQVFDDFQRTTEWQTTQAVNASGLIESGPSEEAKTEVQDLKAKIARLETEKTNYQKDAKQKMAKLSYTVTFYKTSWEHED